METSTTKWEEISFPGPFSVGVRSCRKPRIVRVQGLLAWEEQAPTEEKCGGVRMGGGGHPTFCEGMILGDLGIFEKVCRWLISRFDDIVS